MGSVVLSQQLEKEIPFKVFVGSVVLSQHLDKAVPIKGPWALCFVATS